MIYNVRYSMTHSPAEAVLYMRRARENPYVPLAVPIDLSMPLYISWLSDYFDARTYTRFLVYPRRVIHDL